jgi:cytochrome d ubiquinol oxidase subunit II
MNLTLDLNTIWFILVGVLFTGYAILDGFDLGIGALHLFTRTDTDRRIMINAIGPVWDGNEVWLVTGGGALFAAFPEVYATAFSGFYVAFVLLLFGLIFRAVAIDFRSKKENPAWRQFWDASFSISSILSSLLIGVALGNIALGIPLNHNHEYVGSFWQLLNPYALLIGITTVALFTMHGAIYGVLKTEGDLHDRLRRWVQNTMIVFILMYVLTTLATLLYIPHMTDTIRDNPVFFVLPIINVLAIANIPREIYHGRDFRAFLSSCASMLALLALFGLGMYPNMILSAPVVENSLTIYNGASSAKTLKIMLIIAIMGIPLVLAYTTSIYWVFRGKVKLDSNSY